MEHYFTSESVTEGHPDKMADRISDAVLDAVLEQDDQGRVACETLVTTGMAIIAGEISTKHAYVHMPDLVRSTIRDIGYTDANFGFDYETCAVMTSIDEQSPDIAQGVDTGGAGDQGMMFGYACDDTEELMPAPIMYAHKLARKLTHARKSGDLPFLRPDGKTMVTARYRDGRFLDIETALVSAQHAAETSKSKIKEALIERVIKETIPEELRAPGIQYLINPTGTFVQGGPKADCGLTGRKIIVDTYGGMGRHGGGAFSGKDATKVDRSAAYAARHAAKNVVAAGLAERCEIQIAYAIGIAEPVSINVDSFGTGAKPDEQLAAAVNDVFDFTPDGIIERLQLRRPIYKQTSAYGHFGRNEPDFTWEKTDFVERLNERARA